MRFIERSAPACRGAIRTGSQASHAPRRRRPGARSRGRTAAAPCPARRVGRVAGGVAVGLEQRPPNARGRSGRPRPGGRRTPRRSPRSRRERARGLRELGQVADLEQRVARVGGERAEHVGAQHRHDHRPVAAGRLAGQPAVVAVRGRRVVRVDERHHLVAEIGHGTARSSVESRNCEPPNVVQASTSTTIASGQPPVANRWSSRSRNVGSKATRLRPHVELAGVALDHVDRRQRPGVVALHARRAVDPQRPVGGVAERVAGQQLALHHEPVERAVQRALPGRPGGDVAPAQRHARPAAAAGSGAKNGVET